MKITNDILYVGVNDHQIDLFEGQYIVPNGMAYNSYVVKGNEIAVMDTVDKNFTKEWLGNVEAALNGKKPDYLVVQHMEPDHSANIVNFLNTYPEATIVSSAKAFAMMKQFFDTDFADRRIVVKEGDTLDLGGHVLNFVAAPMVHWPEVIVTYDSVDKVLFSADGFGKFGALDTDEEWACEARRYYFGIVGKYGAQVQALLKKAANLDIQIICPLHGPILTEDLGYYLNLYNIWSSYQSEVDGIFVAYTSVYGHTKEAVEKFAKMLDAKGCPKVSVCDLAREDMAEAVEDAFKYNKIVLATTTYNAGVFPYMQEFINHLVERNWQNKTVGMIENGTWAPMAIKTMKGMLEKSKNINYTTNNVTLVSKLNEESEAKLDALAEELCQEYVARQVKEPVYDVTALFKIGYGLYVVTSNDGKQDNGLIVNTVTQVTNTPDRIAVCINKLNYSHEVVKKTGKMNVNCLSVEAPFSVFQNFGFQSGRNVNKFENWTFERSANGLAALDQYINAYFSLEVEQYVELETHGMFICKVTEARKISDKETMTYTYYQENVKPKPQPKEKKGFVCEVCGYIYEGDTLPEDYICPLCKHGPADFKPLG